MSDVAITGLGAITSVGMDAVTTCASIRAGLSRPALLDHGFVLDVREQQEIPITGHPAGSVARGFSNVGRWLQLAAVALKDLCSSAALPTPVEDPGVWRQTTCLAVVPVLGERFLPDPNCSEDEIDGAFALPLLERVRRFFGPGRTRVLARGRAGVLESLEMARRHFDRHEEARAIVLVVDSLVDIAGVEWLTEMGRIKSDDNPVGLSPGEAACAFLLEHPASASSRGASPIATVRSVATGQEPMSFLSGEISQGQALAEVIRTVLAGTNNDRPFGGTVIADLNGETWRAHEFGTARTRVPRSLWESDDVMLPVSSTGDAGAATAGIQLAVACRALARGYAGGDRVLVTCSDEEGTVGAAVLNRLAVES
jgi:3-oxoacyl-[acyl-carrier-protein] synthase I